MSWTRCSVEYMAKDFTRIANLADFAPGHTMIGEYLRSPLDTRV